MPIVSLSNDNPFVDGRQSQRANVIRMGVERYFSEMGRACLPEVTLSNGRRADLVALGPKGDVTIVEIKSSIEDFKVDTKWPEYRPYCDRFLFATLADVPEDIFPQTEGLLIADSYFAEQRREAAEHKMGAAKRKDVHLRIARASIARLNRCCAHAGLDTLQFADDG
ncbi:MAG: MmcB family DNA repair protein [Pseudomonadota bacterium]